ncbi:uncharacterized protein FOBCDRAFT_241801 [Fusarium oxysporum Fo47]|uniref:uncharacterized protein n=1 Tax=Fusarium oxysporum Fo47 TaxID=660027 RepID=UPI002869BB88|nr:uncharacterized protein FOBCDRAFT_241801 [Fusarium oxysporum Fo47]QKD57202.2 hypothetical protein FOBCDRAFT_241801 [Fusarium oxysporum Fo47]
MPVTFSVVNHPATSWKTSKVETTENLLKKTSPRDYRRCQRIIRTSFTPSLLQENHISPSENGFIWSAYHAYSQHHHLTIRPEDVWFSILTQISFFINANAEELRSFFVAHEGKKELTVFEAGDLESANIGAMAQRLAGPVSKNVKDPELGDWVMPSFSTTTDTDRVVASVLLMGAMQKYFSYGMCLTCGIPSVTLLGEISDWEAILTRLDRLDQLGKEPAEFAEMLRPILKHMILSFEKPEDAKVTRFWNTLATRNPVGSGTDYITGWITAFCFWDEQGKPKHRNEKDVLAGVAYPSVDIDKVTVGVAPVPVKINDNGNIIGSKMVAGSFGIQATTKTQDNSTEETLVGSQQESTEDTGSDSELNAIQPLSGWLMYEDEAKEAMEAREEKKKALRDELAEVEKLPSGPNDFVQGGKLQRMISLGGEIQELEAF